MDELVGTIETDKATQEIRAPEAGNGSIFRLFILYPLSGTILECFVSEGSTVQVGTKFFSLQKGTAPPTPKAKVDAPPPPKPSPPPSSPSSPSSASPASPAAKKEAPPSVPSPAPVASGIPNIVVAPGPSGIRTERRVQIEFFS